VIVTSQKARQGAHQNGRLEPLENGDCLTAAEFLRRYEGMPHVKKAELIEGVVYMGSPVRHNLHGQPDALIQLWLSHYVARTPGVEYSANTTTKLDPDNVPQPDSMLRICEECGGQSRVDKDDYLVGAPELVVEITASGASIDMRDKLRAYRRNGVKEYLTWRTVEEQFDWRMLSEGEFKLMSPDTSGILRSTVFPGLWLPLKAVLKRDGAAILACLDRSLSGAEHKAFVAKLAAAKRRTS
jgi:Uma2 family endonuclease